MVAGPATSAVPDGIAARDFSGIIHRINGEIDTMRTTIIATIAASAALSACNVHSSDDEDAGPAVSRNYQVGNFEQIEVAGPYEVQVRTGANPSVSANGSQKLLEKTVVEVKNGKLIIRPGQKRSWFNFGGWSTHGKATMMVTVPQLTGATIAGSGGIRIDKVKADDFKGVVAGSGDLDVGTLDVQDLKVDIAGSGSIKGAGKAASAKYDIAGSGDVDAAQLQTEDIKVSIAGSGSVRAHATRTADVDIMGAGDVDISGGAKCKINKAGSGDVRCS
jgi:hypothetical protein